MILLIDYFFSVIMICVIIQIVLCSVTSRRNIEGSTVFIFEQGSITLAPPSLAAHLASRIPAATPVQFAPRPS